MGAVRKGLRYYLFFEQVQISTWVNGLLYYFRKIPLVGNKIPGTIYKVYSLKKVLFVLLSIFRIQFGFFMKFFWLGFFYVIASCIEAFSVEGDFFDNAEEIISAFQRNTLWFGLLLWIFLVVLMNGFYQGWYYSMDGRTLAFIENFGISKKFFARCQFIIDVVQSVIFYLPASFVAGLILGEPLRVMLGISLLYAGFRYFFLYIGRLRFKFFSVKQIVQEVLGIIIGLSFLGIVILMTFFEKVHLGELLFTPITLAILLLLLLFSLRQLLTFKQENVYLVHIYQSSSAVRSTVAEARQELALNISMQKSMVLDQSDKFADMTGSNYLNALLFQRYRKLLFKSLRLRLLGITVFGIGFVILRFFTEPKSTEGLYALIPSIFFLMYMISFGKKIVQMVFVNCDVAMLYYPFYREKNVIISGFIYRFKKTLFYNGLLAGLCYFFFLLASFINIKSVDWMFVGITTFTFLSLILLFSFHELFIYYLLQPFSGDMQVMNPLYKVISGAFWFLAYLNLNLNSTGLTYVIILATVSLLYVIIGFVVIMKMAPRTFRMK